MHEERLRRLNELLPIIEAKAAEWHAAADDADALVRSTKAEIAEETRERRHLRGLTFIPGAIGVGIAGKVLFGSARRAAVTTTAGAVLASGIGLAVIQTPHHPPSHGALPARPPASAPGMRSTPKIDPPGTGGPAWNRQADRPRPSDITGTVEVVHSPAVPDPPTVDTKPTGLPSPTHLPSTPASSRQCLVDAKPVLPIAVLCRRS